MRQGVRLAKHAKYIIVSLQVLLWILILVSFSEHDSKETVIMSFFTFSHISGNKIGWEKTGSHAEPQARGDPGDQTKVQSLFLLFSKSWLSVQYCAGDPFRDRLPFSLLSVICAFQGRAGLKVPVPILSLAVSLQPLPCWLWCPVQLCFLEGFCKDQLRKYLGCIF